VPPAGSPLTKNPEPVVALCGVVALLGRFPALAGLDLRVEQGEIVVVRGPNGAGKTTLLKVIAGLTSVTEGTAVVLGVDLRRHRRAARRAVGLLGHQGFLYDDLTVHENVAFAVRAGGGDAARIDPSMARVGLDGRLRDLRVGACSAGQRRRTALAALVARNPALWLLDEPHTGLDPDARDMLDALVREASAGGTTVILASHDEARAEAVATRVVTVVGGHITEDRPSSQGWREGST
jgi:heme ABC exporter ATP-binding subunit CcmA